MEMREPRDVFWIMDLSVSLHSNLRRRKLISRCRLLLCRVWKRGTQVSLRPKSQRKLREIDTLIPHNQGDIMHPESARAGEVSYEEASSVEGSSGSTRGFSLSKYWTP